LFKVLKLVKIVQTVSEQFISESKAIIQSMIGQFEINKNQVKSITLAS